MTEFVGLAVGPVWHLLDRLPNTAGVQKVNAAIGAVNGRDTLYFPRSVPGEQDSGAEEVAAANSGKPRMLEPPAPPGFGIETSAFRVCLHHR